MCSDESWPPRSPPRSLRTMQAIEPLVDEDRAGPGRGRPDRSQCCRLRRVRMSGTILLRGMRHLFLRVILWWLQKRRKRQSAATLTRAPCAASFSFSSGRADIARSLRSAAWISPGMSHPRQGARNQSPTPLAGDTLSMLRRGHGVAQTSLIRHKRKRLSAPPSNVAADGALASCRYVRGIASPVTSSARSALRCS